MNQRSISVFAFVVLVFAILALLWRNSFLADGFFPMLIQGLAILLMVWARITFGRRSFHAAANPTEGGIVTSGPYRFIRHPIYAAILYFIFPGVLTHLSMINVTLAIIALVAVILRIRAEESFLVVRYPEYIAYAERTKRIIPFII
jgi:protein-S-isoprenylcysteine O-methyltransferase Ste14